MDWPWAKNRLPSVCRTRRDREKERGRHVRANRTEEAEEMGRRVHAWVCQVRLKKMHRALGALQMSKILKIVCCISCELGCVIHEEASWGGFLRPFKHAIKVIRKCVVRAPVWHYQEVGVSSAHLSAGLVVSVCLVFRSVPSGHIRHIGPCLGCFVSCVGCNRRWRLQSLALGRLLRCQRSPQLICQTKDDKQA